MEVTHTPRGLVVSYWNRYYKPFNRHVQFYGLGDDLDQTTEMIAAEITGMTVAEAGKVIGAGLRSFLKDIGFRKVMGYFAIREYTFNDDWWGSFTERGLPPGVSLGRARK
jgi:hypothetical protein